MHAGWPATAHLTWRHVLNPREPPQLSGRAAAPQASPNNVPAAARQVWEAGVGCAGLEGWVGRPLRQWVAKLGCRTTSPAHLSPNLQHCAGSLKILPGHSGVWARVGSWHRLYICMHEMSSLPNDALSPATCQCRSPVTGLGVGDFLKIQQSMADCELVQIDGVLSCSASFWQ